MPSLDTNRIQEPEEDCALRSELQELLGVPEQGFFSAEVTPELVALAEELRHEANRRRRVARRPQPTWLLLAAGLPLAFALVGLGTWGLQQKHRADTLAQAVEAKNTEIQRTAAQAAQDRQNLSELKLAALEKQPLKRRTGSRPAELVIPVERPAATQLGQTEQVKAVGH